MAVQESKHRTRDISVRLFRDGRGTPVVYLHGAGGIAGWLPLFEKIAAKHDLMVPEHPGFGDSEAASWIRNTPDVAMYYLDLFDEMDLKGVHLIGFSLGGWIAAELAVRNAARLKSLTLIAPAGIRIKGIPTGDNFIWGPEENARNVFHDQRFAEQMIAQIQQASQPDIDRALANRYMAARLGWEPRWFNPDLERWLHRIKLPTLALWGENDKVIPAAYADLWRQRVPGIRVELTPHCGHLLPVEKADWAAGKILEFIGGA
jgi:pimeloyl-ACP methyl ester carboxylesterase